MKGHTIIVGFIVVFALFAALLYVTRSAPSPETPVRRSVLVPPAPTIHFQQPTGVAFSFAENPTIPSQVPAYVFEDYTLSQLKQAVVNNLSFFSVPASASSLIRSDSTVTAWSRDGADFVLTTTDNASHSIVFHQQQALTRPDSALTTQEAAHRFIHRLFSFPQGVTLSHTETTTGPFDGLLILDTFSPSEIVGETFSYVLNGVPIISVNESGQQATVVADGLGIIRSATIFPPPKTITPSSPVSLITADDILFNLQQGRGAVVSAYNKQTAGLSGQLTFASFQILNAERVYARSGKMLLPAFLLSGVGTDTNGQHQEATYFLWAARGNNE